jgi:hypothetical protein
MDTLIRQLKDRIKDPDRFKDGAIQTRLAEQILGEGAHGYTNKMPLPASLEQVEQAERELGFHLPLLLRRIYTEIANGGFGPGYGLLGLPPDGATDDDGETAISLTLAIPDPTDPDEYIWPDYLLPVCYYGDNIYACLDCSTEESAVFRWDAGNLEAVPFATSLQSWLENWIQEDN